MIPYIRTGEVAPEPLDHVRGVRKRSDHGTWTCLVMKLPPEFSLNDLEIRGHLNFGKIKDIKDNDWEAHKAFNVIGIVSMMSLCHSSNGVWYLNMFIVDKKEPRRVIFYAQKNPDWDERIGFVDLTLPFEEGDVVLLYCVRLSPADKEGAPRVIWAGQDSFCYLVPQDHQLHGELRCWV